MDDDQGVPFVDGNPILEVELSCRTDEIEVGLPSRIQRSEITTKRRGERKLMAVGEMREVEVKTEVGGGGGETSDGCSAAPRHPRTHVIWMGIITRRP